MKYIDCQGKIKARLKEQGRSQRWLAKKMGVHYQTINRWVNGKEWFSSEQKKQFDQLLK